jgi:multidrug resistance protein, MATE family
MTYQVASGISIATTIRVGQTIGQNNLPGSRRAGFVGIVLAGIVMGGFSLTFWLLPNQIIGLYLDLSQPDALKVAALAQALLALTAIFQIIDGIQVTAAGALRGIKDTQIPMWIGLGAHWCVGLPISYLLGMKLGLGVVGLWLGVAAGLSIAAVVLTWRFGHLSALPQQQPQPLVSSS